MVLAWMSVHRRRRLQTLTGCLLVALVSGTNYVYSAYAPQLGKKLNLSHTQLNIIGIAGNVGTYCFAPISGWVIDKRGYRQPMFAATLLLFFGYGGIRYLFTHAPKTSPVPEISGWTPASLVTALAFCSFTAGAGGILGIYSALNAGVKNVPPTFHASVNGVMNGAFALSAFLFSSVAKEFFAGQTTSLLKMLMLGTSVPVLVGAMLVRPVLSLSTEREGELAITEHHTEEGQRFLVSEDERNPEHDGDGSGDRSSALERNVGSYEDEQESGIHHRGRDWSSQRRASNIKAANERDVYGWGLFNSSMFWVLTGVVGFLCAPGLVYINNVGAIVQALYASGDQEWDEKQAVAEQATQVSLVSICGFWGRLAIGFIADYSSHAHGIPRSTWLILSSVLGVSAQGLLTKIDNPGGLWKVSGLVGVSYGTTFVIVSTLILENFGIAHFSQNSGFAVLSGVLLGNVFNYGFGRNLDAHSRPSGPGEDTRGPRCLEGRMCYINSIYVTFGSCCLALGLSIYALWRRRIQHSGIIGAI